MRRRIYSKDLYYGGADYITVNQNSLDPATMISGDVRGPEIQWIRDNSHRVLGKMTSSGTMTVCRLDDNDSNYFHDGNVADLTGSQGDVFMRLPRFFYHAEEKESGIWNVGFSRGKVASDWVLWGGNDLIGVFKGVVAGGKLRSISGQKASTNLTYSNFKDLLGGMDSGFSMIKWKCHNIMAFLFYAYYGSTDCQSKCGIGTTQFGCDTGYTASMGMADTGYGDGGSLGYINFWGLENWWGDTYEFMDNVKTDGDGRFVVTEDDGETRKIQAYLSSGVISRVFMGPYLDMVPTGLTGSLSQGYCDYFNMIPSAYGGVVVRSHYSANAFSGLASLDCSFSEVSTNTACCTRLSYSGDVSDVFSSSDFINRN